MKSKLLRSLLFPATSVLLMLTPFAIVFLVYSMVFCGSESAVAIASYVIASYTLTVWCIKIPSMIRFFKCFSKSNKYLNMWKSDPRLRIKLTLYGTLLWNTAYSLLQLGLGFYHSSFWYFSMAGYYISLAAMRFYLVKYTRKKENNMLEELKKYRICGIVFLVMNLAVSLMIFFMVYWNRTFTHHPITAIAMAAYTFTAFTMAIISIVKYRKYHSPVYSAAKSISLASACVSMLTLESTMLTAFGDGSMDAASRRIMLASTGGVVSLFIIVLAVYMIVTSSKKLKGLNNE
ncbi:MAG: hypothetical protein IKK70_02515 [Clostridia bacterium]|nr:hypothetical protein [Clostridia bacterium]